MKDPRLRWIAFFARWTLGLLFLMVGWEKVVRMGALEHARMLFVEPYADTWIPAPLLWGLGTVIPFFDITTHVFPRLVLVAAVLAWSEHDPFRLEARGTRPS